MARQRSIRSVPMWLRWLLPAMMLGQIAFRTMEPAPAALAAQLAPPPAINSLRLAALGEPVGFALLLTLNLQAFDTQPGISIPFSQLDYVNLVQWLDAISTLDPATSYPLLLASQVYSQVPDEAKQRAVLDFVYREFLEDPVFRWRWLAHASIIAKHRLGDPRLALRYARAIADDADDARVPSWARQMHIFLLEDLEETEAARILLGGLLTSGTVTDEHEVRFLMERLKAMESADI
ncbi:MAG TPA: hypothetical protein VMW70_12725, partial [Burkholderiales bacterium]|nr:hypothetical protein [Burkholderiales bacterium]